MNVAIMIPYKSTDPYCTMFYHYIKKKNIQLIPFTQLSRSNLKKIRKKTNIIHLHWIAQFYLSNNPFKEFYNACSFISFLLYMKKLKFKIIWTVHNIMPHQKDYDPICYLVNYIVANTADLLVVHGSNIAKEIRKKFHTKKIIEVIHYGSYVDYYNFKSVSRAEARKVWHISDGDFVYLNLGVLREYKAITEIIDAFNNVDIKKKKLLLAGSFMDKDYERKVRNKVKNNKNIIALFRPYEDGEVPFLLNACDVVVLPFKKITTSGALILVMSAGKPSITIDKGFVTDVFDSSCGIIIKDLSQLEKAMYDITKMDLKKMANNNLRRIKEYDWDNIAGRYYNIYKSLSD